MTIFCEVCLEIWLKIFLIRIYTNVQLAVTTILLLSLEATDQIFQENCV